MKDKLKKINIILIITSIALISIGYSLSTREYRCIGNICFPTNQDPYLISGGVEGLGVEFKDLGITVHYHKDEYTNKTKKEYISKTLKNKLNIRKYTRIDGMTIIKYQISDSDTQDGETFEFTEPYCKILINNDVYTIRIDGYDDNTNYFKSILPWIKYSRDFYNFTSYPTRSDDYNENDIFEVKPYKDLIKLPWGNYLYKNRNGITVMASDYSCYPPTLRNYQNKSSLEEGLKNPRPCNQEYTLKDKYNSILEEAKKDKETYKEVTYYENEKYNIMHYYKHSTDDDYTNVYYSSYNINKKGTKIFYSISGFDLSGKKDNNYKEIDKILKSIKINGEEWNMN